MMTLMKSILLLLMLILNAEATLKCGSTTNQRTHITCTTIDDYDNKLQRGLISDNNDTTKVTLRSCRISEVDYEAFENLFALQHIDLSQNEISELKLGVLDGTLEVTHLNLSQNSLTEFPLGLFDQKPNLTVLDLHGNKLKNFELGIFDPLAKLTWLDLSDNLLKGKDLNPYIFDQSTKIDFISLASNDMNGAPDNLLHALESLATLSLDGCLLKEVPMFATKNNLKSLRELTLSLNEIKRLDDATTFINLENLRTLNLAYNILESIDAMVFKALKSLKILVLRGNKLTNLPDTIFKDMKSLGNIDLSHNQITNVPVNAFRGTSLKNLNLANNRITYLTNNFCLELRNSGAMLSKFYFNQNPWQCSCLREVLDEVKKYQISYNDVFYDGRHAVCVTTSELHCKRHDTFNNVYTDMYDSLILGKQIDV